MEQIYRENLMDHFKNPRNFGKIDNCFSKKEVNPLCGDEVEIFVLFEDDKVKDVKFLGSGCAISLASASMFTEKIKGMSLEEVKKLESKDMFDLLGIKVGVNRIRCVTLPLKALEGIC
tara:strand:- start:2978 stop:3331 length:354 start_codon:yes stop_codon:yes gene_type:complete